MNVNTTHVMSRVGGERTYVVCADFESLVASHNETYFFRFFVLK